MDDKTDRNVTANLLNSDISKPIKKESSRQSTLKIVILALSVLVISLAIALLVTSLTKKHCLKEEKLNNSTESKKNSNKQKIVISNKIKSEIENFENSSKWNQSRLPDYFKPSSYKLDLKIDVIEKEFYGNCSIIFDCFESSNQLVLHSGHNIILKSRLPVINEIDQNGNEITNLQVANIEVNRFYSYIIIELKDAQMFQRDKKYSILFENYYSKILNNLKGIYYSTYTTSDREIKSIVVSQLQPLDARAVFPSFDEPSMKAIFNISIQHQKNFTALSNMEEISISNINDKWLKTQFNSTPIMSTYILAFVVSDFEHVTTTGPNNLKIRVWTRSEYINNTAYMIENIPKAYQFYEDYFNISEVVTKADHLAAPDFNAGAMENWGLILYRESALVYDSEKSLLEDEFFVMLVMCHEVSHSWFGNMATLKWWDNVWLNEAFANTLMYFAMDHIKPEFHVHETLVVHDIFAVMEKDSLETTHPVSTHVEDPRQVQQYFDEISYEKGLAVLRMLRGFIGDEDFKLSIRNHINKYMFSNCDMNELFEVISSTVNNRFNVSQIMNGWLTQPGYPIVNVTSHIIESNNTIVYELNQEYFILYQSSTQKQNYLWTIPFTYKIQDSNTKLIKWMNTSKARIEMPLENNSNKWLFGNLDFMGYYRVNYDKTNWMRIIAQLKRDHTVFTPVERASLIFDSFTFARIGYVDYSIALDLASYLINEEHYVPWKSYFKSISYLNNLLSTSSCYGLFQTYGAKQLEKIYDKLGWNDEGSFLERLLRSHVLNYSAYFENQDATQKSKRVFENYLKKRIE